MKTCWNDLTIKDLLLIKEIDSLQLATQDEKNLKVAAIVAEEDYDKILLEPLASAKNYIDAASFLLEKPKPIKAKRFYTINGREYKLFKNPAEMNVAQYIDFQAIYQDGFDKRPAELLSVMLIPKGHEYGDGYDKEQVVEDMYDMRVEEALGVCDFFIKRYSRSIKQALAYCRIMSRIMRILAKKKDKEKMRALEIQTNLIADELECIYGSLVSPL